VVLYDHTYLTKEGNYMFIEKNAVQTAGQKGRLISPFYKRQAGGVCLTFWYHMFTRNGVDIGTLNIYVRQNGVLGLEPIWSISRTQGTLWRTASVTVQSISDFQIVFEGIFGSEDGNIAIDDVFVDINGKCLSTGSCDFEQSICNWIPLDGKYNFLRISPQQLQTITPNILQTNLNFDITTNSKYGHFIWIGAGYYSEIPNNSVIKLMSETFMGNDFLAGGCMSFALYLNGKNSDTLNIIQKIYAVDQPILKWTVSGDQGDMWKFFRVPLQSVGDTFELFIEAIINDQSSSTNIAIDDVFVTKTDCFLITTPNPVQQFDCGDGSFVTYDKVCNFIKDCPISGLDEKFCADCDFELSSCSWIDDSFGNLIWNRAQAGTVSDSGPPVDHTLSSPNGWYIYVDSQKGEIFDFADLVIDKDLKPCSSTCELEFYYHMLGETDDLNLYLATNYLLNTKYTKLIEYVGDKGDKWNRAIIPLGRISKPFRLVFAAERFWNDAFNDIALDDIKLLNCEFPPGL
jgi:hypothetical protein